MSLKQLLNELLKHRFFCNAYVFSFVFLLLLTMEYYNTKS